jgi:glycosyltransferase involved in cell wall biosynthesis
MTKVTVVIRAYNEAPQLRRLFEHLREIRFDGGLEYVVVDNGSTDKTSEVAKLFGAKIVNLAQAEFSYPKSLNVGVAAAKNELVMCLVAHAYPEDVNWLNVGARHFRDPKVAGVFSYTKPHVDAPFWDRLGFLIYWWSRIWGVTRIKSAPSGRGVFGATNIAVRRSVWAKHHFNEAFGAGGEDNEWASWAISHGYDIIRDPAFTVRHSHYLRTLRQSMRMLNFWLKTSKPRPFRHEDLEFKNNGRNLTE